MDSVIHRLKNWVGYIAEGCCWNLVMFLQLQFVVEVEEKTTIFPLFIQFIYLTLLKRIFLSLFSIPDSGFRIPDSGFRIPDSGFRIPDSGFRIPAFSVALVKVQEPLETWCYMNTNIPILDPMKMMFYPLEMTSVLENFQWETVLDIFRKIFLVLLRVSVVFLPSVPVQMNWFGIHFVK